MFILYCFYPLINIKIVIAFARESFYNRFPTCLVKIKITRYNYIFQGFNYKVLYITRNRRSWTSHALFMFDRLFVVLGITKKMVWILTPVIVKYYSITNSKMIGRHVNHHLLKYLLMRCLLLCDRIFYISSGVWTKWKYW